MPTRAQASIPPSSAILALLVNRASTSFEVLAHSRSRRVPGGVRLRAPSLAGPGGGDLPDDTIEIVGEVLDANGALLDAYAWAGISRDFADTVGPDGETWRGFSRRDEDLARRMFVPIRRSGRYLVFSRSYFVKADGTRSERRDPIAAFRLRSGSDGAAEPGVPPSLLAAVAVPGLRDLGFRAGFDSFAAAEGALVEETGPPKPYGHIAPDGVTSLRPPERRDNRFDIVITGDGFAESDIEGFKRDAASVIEGLRSLSPFRELDTAMNYHTVVAISAESGISDPAGGGGERKTYYRSTTGYMHPEASQAIGTEYPQLVHQAASLVKPWSEIELVVVIANIDRYGGYAMRRHGVAFIARGRHDGVDTLVRLAAHEGGHVIAKLADEYISCDPYDPHDDRPNVATAKELEERKVPWQDLAEPSDLTPTGDFKVVHRFGDPMNANGEPELPEDQLHRLGAFWGCMYTKPPADVGAVCAALNDARGADFFRPMARCLMRRRTHSAYCRACAHAVAEAIRAKSSVTRPRKSRTGGSPPAQFPLAAQRRP